jgi:hypothetical protein
LILLMKILETRMQQKHDIAANWDKSNFVPLVGEIIVYDDHYIDSNLNRIVVAPKVRFKIGDGSTPVKNLPFSDSVGLSSEVGNLALRIDELAASQGISALKPVDGTIIITNTGTREQSIQVAIAPVEGNALRAVEGGLFVPTVKAPEYTAGNGIELVDTEISVKLADTTHGLVAVDGALTINLATKESDGAMSKEDKAIIESIPKVYVAHKYEVAYKPEGTLVDYRDKEIRIMCPADTEWTKQASGENADPNAYYIGFKAYAPKGAVSFREDLAEDISDDTRYYFENNEFAGIDEYGRSYSIVWLPVARYAEDSWIYYGAGSTETKYIGWFYTVEWYSAEDDILATDTIRINLSNEECHNNINSFYGSENDVATKVTDLQKTIADIQKDSNWSNF